MIGLESFVPMSFIVFLHLLLAGGTDGGTTAQKNQFVRVDISLSDTLFQPGGKGEILVSLTPIDGIHVNVDPPVTISLGRDGLLSLLGDPDIPTDKETGFLSTVIPIEQTFSIADTATSGEHTVTGTITYYFCSDSKGWCRKQSQAVTLPLNIREH